VLGSLLLVIALRASSAQASAVQAGVAPDVQTNARGSIVAAQAQPTGTQTVYLPLVRKTSVVYLPMIIATRFTAYSYHDNFDDRGSGWPYGSVSEYNGRSAKFQYGYKEASDGSEVYHIRVVDLDDYVFLTGPEPAVGNFVYDVIMRRVTSEKPKRSGLEYGLLLSPKPIDPSNPVGESVYTFQIRLRRSTDDDPSWLIEKWRIDGLWDPVTVLSVPAEETEYLTAESGFWNRLKIIRTRNKLDFYLTTEKDDGWRSWQHVHSLTDDALPYQLYIGFYAFHTKEVSYPFEFQFDGLHLNVTPF
jgi:hypothetical protein